jgi:hypothetical protein
MVEFSASKHWPCLPGGNCATECDALGVYDAERLQIHDCGEFHSSQMHEDQLCRTATNRSSPVTGISTSSVAHRRV